MMYPRRPSSTQWTALPQEWLEHVEEIFQEEFAFELDGSQLFVEGQIYPEEVLLRVGFLEKGRLKQNNFEISIDYSPLNGSLNQVLPFFIDVFDFLLKDYFLKETALPYLWTELEFHNQKYFFQFSTDNTLLDKEADALLGLEDPSLVKTN